MGFRDILPASLQEIVQNGLLDATFEQALVPNFLYDDLAIEKPWGAQLGAQAIFTRGGLITPYPTPVTGSDATDDTYGFEQYSVKMDQYGRSIKTNMATSAMSLAPKFLEDQVKLGIHAAQSLNLVAQAALYGAFGQGTTYVTATTASSTTITVNDATGFQNSVANLPTTNSNDPEGALAQATPTLVAVSSSNPLSITLGGVANTVTGVTLGAVGSMTLTLGTAAAGVIGAAVIGSNAPVQYRPNARTSASTLVSGDIATLSLFQQAVTRLRSMNVPRVNGAYTAHVHPQTVQELFQDQNFLLAYRGQADSSAYRGFTPGESMGEGGEYMGRFSGIDWILNTVTPVATNPSGVTYYRPIVAGAESLIKAPFENLASLVTDREAGGTVQIDMVNGVARILRAPLDNFGQVLTSTWSWIGDYTVGTDLLTGDSATYKRAVVVEHA